MLLDGAHNPAGAATLALALDDLRPYLATHDDGSLTLVLAMMADKDAAGVLAALCGSDWACEARVICTQVEGARALSADALAAAWPSQASGRAVVFREPMSAIAQALGERGTVVVAGSLYLVGAVRGLLLNGRFGRTRLVDRIGA
jgi:dihydrofolate synthase/folylpolyglutamate synthase